MPLKINLHSIDYTNITVMSKSCQKLLCDEISTEHVHRFRHCHGKHLKENKKETRPEYVIHQGNFKEFILEKSEGKTCLSVCKECF